MGGTVLVMGSMSRTPFAGMAWQVLHYLEGFRRLGFEPYYVEDTGDWAYDPDENAITSDPTYAVGYLSAAMSWWGYPDRWAYRSGAQGGRLYGRSEPELAALIRRADALVNLTGATVLRDEHLAVPVRIYLETDPVLPQLEVAQNRPFTIDLLSAHTHHFTFGENLGARDCGVPPTRFSYLPTRQPVVLDWWNGRSARTNPRYTTIGNWRQTGKDIGWEGSVYTWSKHAEFLKFADLPVKAGGQLELAVPVGNGIDEQTRADLDTMAFYGWRLADAMPLSRDLAPYRSYIRSSYGEFTVAKDANVRLRSGWFSDRSACYLAAGRPVVTQDTGFGNILPVGRGLFAFQTLEDVLAAFEEVAGDYAAHRRDARAIAEEYFRAEKVVGSLAAETGLR